MRSIFFRFLKQTGIKVLLVIQAAALTPLSQLSAEVATITVEVQKPMDEMWRDFDSSYEGLLLLVDRLEKTAHALQSDDNVNPQALNELRLLVIRLAQFGASSTSFGPTGSLVQDMIDLFVDEEEGEDPCKLWQNTSQSFYGGSHSWMYAGNGVQYLPCGFWKSAKKAVKRCAHKVEKFIRHHKEEILIGAGVVVIVGAVAYLAVGACAAKGAAAAAGAAASAISPSDGKSSSEHNDTSNRPSAEFPSKEAQIIEQISDLKNALTAEEVKAGSDMFLKNDPLDPGFADYVKNVGAKIAHDVWREIGKTGALALEVEEEIKKIGSSLFPDEMIAMIHQEGECLTLLDPTHENWKGHIAEGHKKIDQWFNQSIPYDEEFQDRLEAKFATGTPPFPINASQKLLEDIKKTSQVANLVRSGQAGTTIVEEVAVMNRSPLGEAVSVERKVGGVIEKVAVYESPGIRIRMDGVWEIEGQNIKKFDMKMFNEKKMDHVFGKEEHQLERFTCSNNVVVEKITRSIVEADKAGKIPLNKDFSVRLHVDGFEVEVRGIVLDGELRYGTFFIPRGN